MYFRGLDSGTQEDDLIHRHTVGNNLIDGVVRERQVAEIRDEHELMSGRLQLRQSLTARAGPPAWILRPIPLHIDDSSDFSLTTKIDNEVAHAFSLSAIFRSRQSKGGLSFESSEMSGTDVFEEIVNLEEIAKARDPFYERVLEIVREHGEDLLPTS